MIGTKSLTPWKAKREDALGLKESSLAVSVERRMQWTQSARSVLGKVKKNLGL